MSLLGAGAFSRAGSVGSWSIGGERAFSLGALEHWKDGVSLLGAGSVGSWSRGGEREVFFSVHWSIEKMVCLF